MSAATMLDQTGSRYHVQHATFDLPARFRDRTVHTFTLGGAVPSEFSVVMSQAEVPLNESLDGFAERLLHDLAGTLPHFSLASKQACAIDGSPAIGLHYSWRADDIALHQRQVVTFVQDARPASRHAFIIGATCKGSFTQQWSAAFDSLLASMSLRRKLAPPDPAPEDTAGPASTIIFALSERRGTLRLFSGHEEACRRTDALEVEQEQWLFFDAMGAALAARFVIPNSGTRWFKAGTYVLDARPHGTPLRECIHLATVFVPDPRALPLASIAEVKTYLDQWMRY